MTALKVPKVVTHVDCPRCGKSISAHKAAMVTHMRGMACRDGWMQRIFIAAPYSHAVFNWGYYVAHDTFGAAAPPSAHYVMWNGFSWNKALKMPVSAVIAARCIAESDLPHAVAEEALRAIAKAIRAGQLKQDPSDAHTEALAAAALAASGLSAQDLVAGVVARSLIDRARKAVRTMIEAPEIRRARLMSATVDKREQEAREALAEAEKQLERAQQRHARLSRVVAGYDRRRAERES